jgi:hypothetical protein
MRDGLAAVAARTPLVDDAVARTFGVETILPSQQGPRRRAAAGTTALAAAVLWNACQDAGLLPRRGPVSDQRRALARAWLLGELDQEVPLSVAAACAAVGLDGDALAAAVRRTRCQRRRRAAASLRDFPPFDKRVEDVAPGR